MLMFLLVTLLLYIMVSLQLVDDDMPNRNVIIVLDNGKGMTTRQLNNWAIYRLSKFIRKDSAGKLLSV